MRQFGGLIIGLFLGLVMLVGGFKVGFAARSNAHLQSHVFRPFVLSEHVTHFSQKNVGVKEVDWTIARRADGSLVESFNVKDSDSPDGNERIAVFIWDVPSRRNIMLEPFTKSAMTQFRSPKEIADFLSSQQACSDAIVSANSGRSTEQFLGYTVVRLEETSKAMNTISWVAPDLDCFPLRQTVTFLEPAHAGLHHEDVATKIDEVEPPSSMFDVPWDYIERSPAEIQAEYSRKFGGVQFWGTSVDDAERQYRQHQAH